MTMDLRHRLLIKAAQDGGRAVKRLADVDAIHMSNCFAVGHRDGGQFFVFGSCWHPLKSHARKSGEVG